MTQAPIPTVRLSSGERLPQIGLGTWPMDDDEAERTVATALQLGYRLIDTAASYGNEVGVGRGVKASGIPREDVIITTKLQGRNHGYEEALRAFDESAERLGVDYVDIFLIHWPLPKQDRYVDTWRAFVELMKDGRVRTIGVSNFKGHHIDRLIEETGVTPAINQIQLHPSVARAEQRSYDHDHDIVTESWSPLGRGANAHFGSPGAVTGHPTITELAHKYDKTPGQIILRWHVELGVVAIPKSSNPTRLAQNLDIGGFSLDEDEMTLIGALDQGDAMAADSDQHEEF